MINTEMVFGTASDYMVIGGELLAVTLVLLLINLIVTTLFRRVDKLPGLARFVDNAKNIRRLIRRGLMLIWFVLILAILSFNGYLIYRGEAVLAYSLGILAQLPPDFWIRLGTGLAAVGVLTILVRGLIVRVDRLFRTLADRAKAYEQLKANDESVEKFFALLTRLVNTGLWIGLAVVAAQLLPLPPSIVSLIGLILRVYVIIALGLLFVRAIAAIIDSLDALLDRYQRRRRATNEDDGFLHYYERLHGLIPLFRRSLEYVIYLVVATLTLQQDERISSFAELGPPLIQVVGIFFLSRVAVEVINLAVDRAMSGSRNLSESEEQQRLTLTPVMKSLLRYVVYFVAFVLILNALSLDVTPILAGAGIATVVIGLSAQPLINDIVSGFFILFENMFLVGDYIETGNARGVVEAIDIRTTRIRDPDGQQHILRNGQINDIINFSKKYTFAVVEVGVAYESDLDHVYKVLKEAGIALKMADKHVIAPTEVQGLQDFGASELTIRTVTRVKPGRHLQVARDYRKLVKEAFDREGIEIPFTQQVVTFKDSTALAQVMAAEIQKAEEPTP